MTRKLLVPKLTGKTGEELNLATLETALGTVELSEQDRQALGRNASFINYRGYRGDALLKRAGVAIEWSHELFEEYRKCANDPVYFMENYIKVIHVDRGLVPFVLRPYQKQLVKNVHENRHAITMMARQSGKSATVTAYLLWYILFNEYKTVLLLANKADTAREILGKAQIAYMHLPKFLQQGIVEGGWNKGSMSFENGSRAIALATGDAAARGYTANMLILDEAAHIEHWEAFASSTLPIISSGTTTKIIMISTPYGLNHFYSYWNRAELHNVPKEKWPGNLKWNGYVPLKVTWKEVPDRDARWYEETMQELNWDQQKFDQEYNCEFMGSSGTLIAGWKLKELAAKIPIYEKDGLSKYVDPVPGHIYVMTCDVSEGKGLDYSTFQIIDVTSMPFNQVATFRSNIITPGDYAEIVYRTATAYNEAAILIEHASLGPMIAQDIFDLDYDNMLFTKSQGRLGKQITFKSEPTVDLGIKMTKTTKTQGCSLLKLLIEQNQFIINDHYTIEELSRFVRKLDTYKAEEGTHDDLVMPLVCFGWLTHQDYFKDLTDNNPIQKLRDKKSEDIEATMLQFGLIRFSEEARYVPSTADLHKDLWSPIKNNLNPQFNPYKHNDEPVEDDYTNLGLPPGYLPNF